MSNPMEGASVGKRTQQTPLEALAKATVSREELKKRHPEFFQDKKETPEKKSKGVDPDAVAHDFHQRRLLGADF